MNDRLVQVIVLVEDLASARRWIQRAGLGAIEGGRHPGRGTANLIVPFHDQYLELLAVVDVAEARASSDGRPVIDALTTRGPGLARWSLETADITATSERLGLAVENRQRVRPDEVVVRWRSVGVNETWADPWKCAFMSWTDPATHPARATVVHPCAATGFSQLDVGVPSDRAIHSWLGAGPPDGVGLCVDERRGPIRLSIDTPDGPMPIDTELGSR